MGTQPRLRPFSATVHISTPLAEGVCRALRISSETPRSAASLETWIWENLARWNRLAAQIEEEAERAQVTVGQFARTLGFIFQTEDDWCIKRQAPVWSGLKHSHAWTRTHAQLSKKKRVRPDFELPEPEPITPEVVMLNGQGAAELLDVLERRAAGGAA